MGQIAQQPAPAVGGVTNPAPPAEPERVSIVGAWVHRVTMDEAVEHIARALDANTGGWVVTPNLDILHKLTHDKSFAELVERIDRAEVGGSCGRDHSDGDRRGVEPAQRSFDRFRIEPTPRIGG